MPIEAIDKGILKKLNEDNLLVVRVGVGIGDNVVVFDKFVGAAYSDNTIQKK